MVNNVDLTPEKVLIKSNCFKTPLILEDKSNMELTRSKVDIGTNTITIRHSYLNFREHFNDLSKWDVIGAVSTENNECIFNTWGEITSQKFNATDIQVKFSMKAEGNGSFCGSFTLGLSTSTSTEPYLSFMYTGDASDYNGGILSVFKDWQLIAERNNLRFSKNEYVDFVLTKQGNTLSLSINSVLVATISHSDIGLIDPILGFNSYTDNIWIKDLYILEP